MIEGVTDFMLIESRASIDSFCIDYFLLKFWFGKMFDYFIPVSIIIGVKDRLLTPSSCWAYRLWCWSMPPGVPD